ncbi:MAG: dTDP-glucose 4,6-dehydratase [Phycisphaerales bacterium]|nr:dTDP-glucose 4,6-dehydratase [Phycisphaerales bacterium]
MNTWLITGAAGFIGGHFTHLLARTLPGARVIALDCLNYAGDLVHIQPLIDAGRIVFIRGDISDRPLVDSVLRQHAVDLIINFAAQTHVDRSIDAGVPFIHSNMLGTQVLLDAARQRSVERFVQVSTDEVYGSLPLDQPQARFTESSPLAPNSPYSASKAGADFLVRAASITHGLPVMIARPSNNFGPYQYPEKLIPYFVMRLMQGQRVPLYGDGLNVRDWLHVQDNCRALLMIAQHGQIGETYNIGADNQITNRQITQVILDEMHRSWDESVELVADRPGHDRRYAIDSSKLRQTLGWQPQHDFDTALRQTIRWYRANQSWCQNTQSQGG